MRVALFEPDIAQNTATIIRMCVCFGVPVDIIEPCGFVWDDKGLARAGMDYLKKADITRYMAWPDYMEQKPNGRLVLMTTKGSIPHTQFTFQKDDILLFGRESCGAPQMVHDVVDGRIIIPMKGDCRSLNIAMSCAIALGESLRQTGSF